MSCRGGGSPYGPRAVTTVKQRERAKKRFVVSTVAAATWTALGVSAKTGPVAAGPASSREIAVPAEYRTITKQVVATAPGSREVPVPAQIDTLSREVQVADASTDWRSMLCETNATTDKLKQIQQALASAGHDPGPIDGVVRAKTMSVVSADQRAKGLPVDAHLNLETVKSLGVSPN